MTISQATATDPVCGMQVSPEDSRKSVCQGKPFYFCSESCLKKFDDDPEGVLAKRSKKECRKWSQLLQRTQGSSDCSRLGTRNSRL